MFYQLNTESGRMGLNLALFYDFYAELIERLNRIAESFCQGEKCIRMKEISNALPVRIPDGCN
jgi:hypothetical protein